MLNLTLILDQVYDLTMKATIVFTIGTQYFSISNLIYILVEYNIEISFYHSPFFLQKSDSDVII